jgi:uncharacterized protein (TIGR03083 family)
MDYDEHVAAARREASGLVAALWAGPISAAVPTCPGWLLRDLAVHVGEFAGFWTHVVCEGTGRVKTPYRDPPADPALVAWCEELLGHQLEVLENAAPDTEIWTWAEHDHSARFIARRAAHELAVHRFDAESARGEPAAIEAALAADGIDEVLMMVNTLPRPGEAAGQTLHLHGTDRGDEWFLTLGPEAVEIARVHAKGDLALRGAVSDLELVLYGRPPLGEVTHFGDDAVLAAWYREFTF